jgi:acyl-CoA thioesterase-1
MEVQMSLKENNVMIIGDSILAGVVYDEIKKRYTYLKDGCIKLLNDDNIYQLDNYSKFGQTTSRALKMLPTFLNQDKSYQYALIELGGNDCDFNWKEVSTTPDENHDPKVGLKEYLDNMKEIVALLKSNHISPIVETLHPIDAEKYYTFLSQQYNSENLKKWLKDISIIYRYQEQYNDALMIFAERNHLPLLNVRQELLSTHDYSQKLCLDGIHLNENGQKLLAKAMKNALGELTNE